MEIIYLGLVTGLIGSLHCVGMCGPIALSLPLRGHTFGEKLAGGLLYNIGRTVTYGLMGAIFGAIGQGFQLIGFQQWISVVMGVLMIVSVLLPSLLKPFNTSKLPFTGSVRKAIQRLFTTRSFGGLFVIGILNGLLPCGLVYVAIASAIGTGDLMHGIGFMVMFGLGTLPMLLAISLLGNMIGLAVRNKINKVIPYVVVFIGIIFILRGLSLGIPFLSPPKSKLSPSSHMQSAKSPQTLEAIQGSCCHSNTESEKIDSAKVLQSHSCCSPDFGVTDSTNAE